MLAILKSGAAFVPFDENIPKKRLEGIVKDTKMKILIAQSKYIERLDQIDDLDTVILVDAWQLPKKRYPFKIIPWKQKQQTKEKKNLPLVTPKHLAYVIFTSGTTGKPKGVPITHENLYPLMKWQEEHFDLGLETNTLQTLSLSFDFGVQEVLTTLLFGGTLHFCSKELKLCARSYCEYILENAITMLYSTPSFFETIVKNIQRDLSTLSVILLGGETLKRSLVERIRPHIRSSCKIFNGYGPTEASINATMYLAHPSEETDFKFGSVPIGQVTANNTIYILNKSNQVCPINVSGEIYIGGPGLAGSYWENLEESRKVFVPHPYIKGEILYKTGDIAKYLPSGDVEFLGRKDSQVKVRGYRIELGDVELAIKRHSSIDNVNVLMRKDKKGVCTLSAYCICKKGKKLSAVELKHYLDDYLISAMIPQRIYFLDHFPINKNGKLDVITLDKISLKDEQKEPSMRAPRNEFEKIIVEEFKTALCLDEMGVEQNFFELGGHSLLVGVVHERLVERLKKDFPISKIFQYPKPSSLAKYLVGSVTDQGTNKISQAKANKQKKFMKSRFLAREVKN